MFPNPKSWIAPIYNLSSTLKDPWGQSPRLCQNPLFDCFLPTALRSRQVGILPHYCRSNKLLFLGSEQWIWLWQSQHYREGKILFRTLESEAPVSAGIPSWSWGSHFLSSNLSLILWIMRKVGINYLSPPTVCMFFCLYWPSLVPWLFLEGTSNSQCRRKEKLPIGCY